MLGSHRVQAQQTRYAEVRLTAPTPGELKALAAIGVRLGHLHLEAGVDGQRFVRTVVSEHELDALLAFRSDVEIVVPDLTAAYRVRPAPDRDLLEALRREAGVEGFEYGSMGGYYTLAEVEAALDKMRAEYPDLVTERVSIGQSVEGREIWMVKISANADADEAEPEALYTALHHAREPQSMATVVYFMYHLLENYGSDPEVTYLLDHRALYFVPVLNPDGYVFNETMSPNGGGLWRKNRRDNGGNVFGVDLNRNYGYEWGRDDIGSSPDPNGATYRGPASFSEPETQAIRDFVAQRAFRVALNYHTYGNLLFFPWEYEPIPTPDDDRFRTLAAELTRNNGYRFGRAAEVLYRINGGADDWMYGEQISKSEALAFTPEVGGAADGFWPAQSRIVPLAEENVYQNLGAAWAAGAYPGVAALAWAEAEPQNDYVDPGERALVTVQLSNYGIADVTLSVRLKDPDGDVEMVAAEGAEPVLVRAGTTVEMMPIEVRVSQDLQTGTPIHLVAELDIDGVHVRSVAARPLIVGTPRVFFADDASSLGAWTVVQGAWGLTDINPASPPAALADNPIDNPYMRPTNNVIKLREPLDFRGIEAAAVRFKGRWEMDSDVDFAQVFGVRNGSQRTPLSGRYTQPGSGQGRQPLKEPGLAGRQLLWVEESMDLSAFAGEDEVEIWFSMRTAVQGPLKQIGFDIDDVEVVVFDTLPTANDPDAPARRSGLASVYPNPTSGRTTIRYALGEPGEVILDIVDLLGRRVTTLAVNRDAGEASIVWDSHGVPSGLYFVRLHTAEHIDVRPVTILR